jgi:flagellar motor protein MotB
MGEFKPAPKQAPPAYMVSFCDMMTLILTFFILLVSMSKEQQAGLVAKGVGSFIVAVKSHGLNGIMSGTDKQEVFEHMRRRFNLPPEEDPELRADDHLDASNMELIKTQLLDALEPHSELTYPQVATFEPGSSELDDAARSYLMLLSPSLKPKFAQVLQIEGHAAAPIFEDGADRLTLALARAEAVRRFLVEEAGFLPDRVQARAWFQELELNTPQNHFVDLRLITPGGRSTK